MKGVEGIGFSLLLSILVLAVFLPLFFSFYGDFRKVRELNEFKNGLEDLFFEFDLLKSTGSGSFSRVSITIPSNYELRLMNDSVIVFNGVESNGLLSDVLFSEDYSFREGEYELVLCYVSCDVDTSFSIIFR